MKSSQMQQIQSNISPKNNEPARAGYFMVKRDQQPTQVLQRSDQATIVRHKNSSNAHSQQSNNSRSRSITRRSQFASPSARRPNIMPRFSHEASIADSGHFSSSTHQIYGNAASHAIDRKAQSSHQKIVLHSQKSMPSSNDYLRNRSDSGGFLCSNNDNKKARYTLKNNNLVVVCAKCAIALVEAGQKIEQIGANSEPQIANPTQPTHPAKKLKIVEDAILNIDNLAGRLGMSRDSISNRKAEINSLCGDMQTQLEILYQKLKNTIQESKKSDLRRLSNLRDTCLMLLEAHQQQSAASIDKLRQVKEQIQLIKQSTCRSGNSEHEFRGGMAGFADRIEHIEVYLRQSTEELKCALLPSLRNIPIWDGNIFTFLEAPKPSPPVEFSFVGPRVTTISIEHPIANHS